MVIDLSPYRRPVEFSTAIAVLDQICWQGAPADRTRLVDRDDLGRAVVFRVVAGALQSDAASNAALERAVPLLG